MTATADVPVMTDRDRAQRLLVLRVVKDWIAAEEKQLRESTAEHLMVGERVPGALDPADQETLLGFVQLTKGRESAQVVDQAALLEWVEEWAPGEVLTVRQVRPAFVTALLAAVKADGGWVDPLTSELVDVAGIDVRTSSPTLTVKPTAEADRLVRDAIADRRLELGPVS